MGRPSSAKGLGTRLAAGKALGAWLSTPLSRRLPLGEYIEDEVRPLGLDQRDRALVHEMVVGTVRWLLLLDWLVKERLRSKKYPNSIVQSFLLIGAYQILMLDSIPPHAAINETVEALKKTRLGRFSGLLNAVLRGIARERDKILGEVIPSLPLHLRYSHPQWMVERWSRAMDLELVKRILKANNERPPLTLRVNLQKVKRSVFLRRLKESGYVAREGLCSPSSVIVEDRCDPRVLPGFDEGLFAVQDEAAQLVGYCLDPRPGECVLDACAGVGGKTAHIGELMGESGEIWAFEPSFSRRQLLRSNLVRLGVKTKVILPRDGDVLNYTGDLRGQFHKVLVDAPCSGLGVIRRHPDIKWNRRPGDIDSLSRLQLRLLSHVFMWLRPNGRLVYATCTYEKEETSELIRAFLEGQEGAIPLDVREVLPNMGPCEKFITQEGFLRCLPPETDGFFVALIGKA